MSSLTTRIVYRKKKSDDVELKLEGEERKRDNEVGGVSGYRTCLTSYQALLQ